MCFFQQFLTSETNLFFNVYNADFSRDRASLFLVLNRYLNKMMLLQLESKPELGREQIAGLTDGGNLAEV